MKSFIGIIKKGEIKWNNEYGVYTLCKDFDGRKVHMELVEENRTLSQNNFYWLYLGVIENETGNLADDVHEFAKRKFLTPKFRKVSIGGITTEIKIPGSTTDLKKGEFSEYIDKISAWCGVQIPDPVEAGFMRHH